MNTRIKELAILAGARTCGGYVTPSGSTPMIWSNEGGIDTSAMDLEMFTSLIVTECTLQCVHNADIDLIDKHFML